MVNVDMFNGKTNHIFVSSYTSVLCISKYCFQHVCRHLPTPREFLSEAIENRFSYSSKMAISTTTESEYARLNQQSHTNQSPTHSQPRKPDPKTLLMTKNQMASLQQSPLMKKQEWRTIQRSLKCQLPKSSRFYSLNLGFLPGEDM